MIKMTICHLNDLSEGDEVVVNETAPSEAIDGGGISFVSRAAEG